ncbi:LytR C-terminal domain-containing protein [Nocardioides sp. BP30]|uniref:LytR C-terminal domain-containing protein n=1 Tax=Nocardioides sp. BP30 TaxID=3036374 RepID=UPI0024682ED5|nr:LytR C-terminal domain-containing protein [Nocardioides sp. BP30]WGL53123.1 LytR C-terminal domain-containing protein [Nocardioides sp. BP30]
MSRLWMRDQRGIALPSPVVLLSIVAVAMALVAFVVTRGHDDSEQRIVPSAHVSAPASSTPSPSSAASTAPATKAKTVKRGKVYVEVFNNSRVKGLAATVSTKATKVGWNVVGTDNWYGSIPATTVYYPQRLKAAGKQLALDLGIHRTAPAIDPMKMDRLTVILTAPLG